MLLPIAVLLNGCITAAVYTTYEVTTDVRSFERQHLDTEIAITLKTRLLESEVKGTGWLDVYCRQGVVVLAGVVEPGSPAGKEAVGIAHRIPGVKRVETYFVPARSSVVADYAIKTKLNARMLVDRELRLSQVSATVVDGHVVLVGVVDREQKLQKVLGHARATGGVIAVKSYIQVTSANGRPAAPAAAPPPAIRPVAVRVPGPPSPESQ
jgi:osmotically-inducible protein OsmY